MKTAKLNSTAQGGQRSTRDQRRSAGVSDAKTDDYQDLADPKFKGKVCIRSLNHVYNLSLMSGLVGNLGEQRAKQWAEGLKANLARAPKGGDTDQIRAVAAGDKRCGVGSPQVALPQRCFPSPP